MHPTTAALLAWYAACGRHLPWRCEVGPYRAWLSEAMLQQTRATTAIPYFERFTARWPTVTDLAAADLGEVLGAWAGLGYYRRARALHAAAGIVARRGGFPTTAAELASLPGVGPYCAAAIASIAFGEDIVAVDGNLARVGARLFGLDAPVDAGPGRAAVAEALASLLPPGRAGDFNQALMDLGALVCPPRRPRCDACPIAASCASFADGRQSERPRRRPRAAPRALRAVALLAERDGAVLLEQRPEGGLLGGLWGPPDLVLAPGETSEAGLARLVARIGLPTGRARYLGSVAHAFTHQRWEVDVYTMAVAPTPRAGRLRPLDGAADLPLSRLAEKLLAIRATGAAPAPPGARRGRPAARPRRGPPG